MNYVDLDSAKVDTVILVGGSTQIPKVRSIIESIFTAEKVRFVTDKSD